MTEKSKHEWSKEQLFSKAQLYAEAMAENVDSDWQFGLWSAFMLEFLVRGAVAFTSPALIADTEDWANILYALGEQPRRSKFVPKSAAITDLLTRAQDLYPEFTREHANFFASHFGRRNSEVHTGNLPFVNIGSSTWLPTFFSVCSVLVSVIGETLESLFGEDMAAQAAENITALRDETAKSAKGTINAHKTVWEQKTPDERAAATRQAEAGALRHYGHRIPCPACACNALLQGAAAGAAKRTVDEDGIYERQVMKPESFYCLACGLKVAGYSKLLAAGLGDNFLATSHYDAIEYFEIDIAKHYWDMMEVDNNENF